MNNSKMMQISNPMLIGAMELLKKDKSPESVKVFMDEVLHARFLAPVVITPEPEVGEDGKVKLTEENKKQFYISQGFAHGFLVLSETAEFCYKCDDFYHANDEGGLAWNDPAIGIPWPEVVGDYKGDASKEGYTLSDGTPLNLSEKDQNWQGFSDTFHF